MERETVDRGTDRRWMFSSLEAFLTAPSPSASLEEITESEFWKIDVSPLSCDNQSFALFLIRQPEIDATTLDIIRDHSRNCDILRARVDLAATLSHDIGVP